jgi:hypothetical protein
LGLGGADALGLASGTRVSWSTELSEAHRLYEAGEIDAAYAAFKPLLEERRSNANIALKI